MSTRSSTRNLFPPLDNPELTILRRSRTDPTLFNNSEMAAEGPGDLPVPDRRTMEELCQPSLNGRGGPISSIAIQETNFRVKNDMIQQVQNSCQFHGLPGDDANKHLDKFLHVTQSIKVNGVTDDALRVNQQVKAVTPSCETCGGPPSFNDFPTIVGNTQNVYAAGAYQAYQAPAYQAPVYQTPVHQPQIPQQQVVTTNEFTNFMKANDAILKNIQTNMTSLTNSNLELKNMFGQFIKMNLASSLGSGTLPDFDADPRVPLILGRSFLKTERALIDVLEGELTLRIGKEAITFNLDQTSRYSANYNDMTANQIDVIDMACEEYSQEVLDFSDVITSGNPNPYYDPIVSTTSPTLTPFENSDFHLEEVDAFLALEDDPTSPKVEQSYVNTEGDILLLEAFLNDDPSLPPPNQGNYLPQVCKELKICEAKSDKSSIDEPLEEDFEPAVQHQRRINPKIHDVIKNEVLKLLNAGVIYPIFDSPWRVCIDYRKLNQATRKYHFPLPFMDQMLKRLAGNQYYCFLDGFSGYFQMRIDLKDQEKPHSLIHMERLLTTICLLGYAMHRACFRGIVLGHKISKSGIEVDKAKVDVIAKLPHPTTVKGIQSFLGYAGFYRRFIQDFSKIASPMTHLLKKDTPFLFSK
nr:reverse transcriptase domain-containing protein [Tanacetum cinerariifolium]